MTVFVGGQIMLFIYPILNDVCMRAIFMTKKFMIESVTHFVEFLSLST